MKQTNQLSVKNFYPIVAFCSILIFLSSLETIIRAKDSSLFLQWAEHNYSENISERELLTSYISLQLSVYTLKVMIPASIAITAFLVTNIIRFSGVFVYLWLVLAVGGLAYNVVDLNLASVFYYVIILFYIALIFFIFFKVGITEGLKR